jgi:hypothetical protein
VEEPCGDVKGYLTSEKPKDWVEDRLDHGRLQRIRHIDCKSQKTNQSQKNDHSNGKIVNIVKVDKVAQVRPHKPRLTTIKQVMKESVHESQSKSVYAVASRIRGNALRIYRDHPSVQQIEEEFRSIALFKTPALV